MNKLIGVVNNTNLGCGYDGLTIVAKKQLELDVRIMGKGEFIAFVNRRGDKVKLLGAQDFVAYHRRGTGQGKIDLRILKHLPNYMSGRVFNYDDAMVEVIRTKFPQWFKK